MDWQLLGIEPTKDKQAITAAYRQMLRQTNPEDKPEEFKALRAAYEAAMAFSDQEDSEPARDETPVGLWMEAVAQVYEAYPSRIDPNCWQQLLCDEVCIGLDTRPAAEEALLKFLMDHFYLPKNVWKVLDDTFDFSHRAEELYEAWPRDFIDHAVLSGIRLEPSLAYHLFVPGLSGTDCDAYRRLYFQANQMPLEEIGSILDQMEALPEQHPYGQALRFRFYMVTQREQEAREGLEKLYVQYPDDPSLAMAWASQCFEDGDIAQAERITSRIIEADAGQLVAKILYARCLAENKQFHQAKEIAYEIMHSGSSDPVLLEEMVGLMKTWNEELIRVREARHAHSPDDTENAIELAWCYAQNERVEEAMTLAQTIDPAYGDAFAYHNLMAKLYHNTGKFPEAIDHLKTVVDVLRNMQEDGSQETKKRIARLPEMLQFYGNCLMQLGKPQEAKAKFEEALALAPEDTEVLSMMGRILYASGDYAYATDIFQRLRDLTPGAWFAEMFLALCLYRQRRDREAFDAVNRALSIQETDLSLYILKMQILVRNGIYEDVHEILNFLKESGAPEDIALDFLRAELTELEKKDEKAALKQYRALQKRVEAGQDLIWTPELYYHLAVLTGNQMDVRQEADRDIVLTLVDKGLSYQEQDTDLLAYKAWVLKRGGLPEDAVQMYKQVLQKQPNSLSALRGLADLYYENLQQNAAEALACYEQLLQSQKTSELYFYSATCKRHLGDLEGARNDYLKELEMDPEDVDGYRGLAFLAEIQGDNEKSLELLEQALNIMAEYDRRIDWMVEHKAKILRRMGRYEEALTFAAEAETRHHYADSLQLQFDICCQFGLWDRARQVLEQWRRLDRKDPDLMAAEGKLNLLQGKLFKAAIAMGPAKHKLPFEQIQDFRLQLADLESNHQRKIQIWSRRVKQNPEDDYGWLNLAQAFWHSGNKTAAQGAAQKALEVLDQILALNLTDEPLYRTRRCLALAILGNEEEAKKSLEKCRTLPLCEFCAYESCKDADIYEAYIEEILGNTDCARKLYTAGKDKWPDDLDFAAGLARLNKKGRK